MTCSAARIGELPLHASTVRVTWRPAPSRQTTLLVCQWSARRGSYRILYRLDDARHLITVSRVNHRAHAYRRR